MYSECSNKNFTLLNSTRLLIEITAKLFSLQKKCEILFGSMLNIFLANIL